MAAIDALLDVLAELWSRVWAPTTATLCTTVIALTLVWSGTTKWRDLSLVSAAMVNFGVVRRPRHWMAASLAILESALGGTLLLGHQHRLVSGAAAALFLAFAALTVRSLGRGNLFDCACFGVSEPISKTTVARSGALAVLAFIAAAEPDPLAAPMTTLWALQLVAGAALLGIAVSAAAVVAALKATREPHRVLQLHASAMDRSRAATSEYDDLLRNVTTSPRSVP